ncbi:histidinol-phosphate aminotransferase [Thiomicrospira aerophila AL3]|uniref:Histidinol-phosphate aminotransferase n=1 Tax=Thiomicrospira aerophila AL3 TaxID=717772 RepID=W0DS06_9GAMM|nr:histidinol-phosphate transaminase [Thiomicrospira aerophila]AHF01212.1 histidinol-phosphate aminotransferase [Thiomicrospira aerophila AL3]
MAIVDQALPHVANISPYIPGKPVSELQRELGLSRVTKLASNENPLGVSQRVEQAAQAALKTLGRYPDGNAYYLRSAIAEFTQRTMAEVMVGNGSNELLEFVGRVFAGPGDEIIFSQYAFAVYGITAQIVGATPVQVPAKDYGHDLAAMAAAITPKTKIIYLANPNNPTGSFFNAQALDAFMQQVPAHVVVVYDEAYLEYVERDDAPSGLALLDNYPNVIVTRTFSKAYGLAALRVGYLLAQPEVVGLLNRIRAPFNVNELSQVCAVAALGDQDFVSASVALNKQERSKVITALTQMGYQPLPSEGNFVCVNMGPNAASINQQLLQLGVIVRPVANYGMADFLRISIGTEAENAHLLSALAQVS